MVSAVKYGALSVPDGQVEVTWDLRNVQGVRTVHLHWQERFGPLVQPPAREGFGSTLLRKVLPMQTNAEVEVEYDPEGLRCRIEAPLVEQRLVPEY